MSQSVMISDELFGHLGALAQDLNQTRQDLIQQALTDYVELQLWKINEIKQSIQEADAGDFASESRIARLNQKYA